jgi:hypothetical protein
LLDQEKAEAHRKRHDHDQENSPGDRMMRAFVLPQGVLIRGIIEHEPPPECEALFRQFD